MIPRPPTPICAFEIAPDGAATPLEGCDPSPPASGFRWYHFDLADPALEPWVRQHLPPTAASALTQSETRPRCDTLDDGMILNLRGVNLNPGADADDMVSIRLWVSDGLILSTRARKVFAADALRRGIESGKAPGDIAAFLCELTYGLTRRIEEVSLETVERTDELEERSLGEVRSLAMDLAEQRQSVIKMRRFLRPQGEAIDRLLAAERWIFDPGHADLMRETANRTRRIIEELDATADRLQAIQDHLDNLQTAALGRNSYVLSVVAAIFLPLGFLTGLFGINVGGMPGVENDAGFWIVTAISLLLGAVLFWVFRALKWL